MASDIIQNGAFAEQKTAAATISIHTHTHTHAYTPTLPKTLRILATIKSKFNFKHIFSDIVYNVENKIDFAKNRGGGGPPWIRPWLLVIFTSYFNENFFFIIMTHVIYILFGVKLPTAQGQRRI